MTLVDTSKSMNMNINTEELEEKRRMLKFAQILKAAENLVCAKCGGLNFMQVYRIKKLSGLVTGTGKDTIAPISVYACADCGEIPAEILEKLNNNEMSAE